MTMKKLSLDLDHLAVESFDTTGGGGWNGTVQGHGFTDTTCQQIICDCPTGSGESCQADMCDTADCGTRNCTGLCPSAGHTCNPPNCYYSYGCVSQLNYTECCLV
jgi:hypothetical protein